MTDSSTDATTVLRATTVPVAQSVAFELFTARLGEVKPPEHTLLAVPIAETVLEPWVGGAVIDRGTDGSECRWATVLEFDRPERLVLAWHIGSTWQLEADPDRASEVEIRFLAAGPSATTVEIEHRHLDRHGPGWDAVHRGVDSERGWSLYLDRLRHLARTGTGG